MSWTKYTVERKEVSYDRGLTWSDTGEYCDGRIVGMYPTLEDCEDVDCELEEYRYTVVEMRADELGKMCTRTNIGGRRLQTYHFPSGIIKHVLLSDPTPHGGGYYTNRDFYYNVYDYDTSAVTSVSIGVWNETMGMRSFASGATIDGNEVEFLGNGQTYCDANQHLHSYALDYCFTIDEFCEWVGETVNVIFKSHWTKQHCSDEWVYDEEYGTNFYTFGERWVRQYDYTLIDMVMVHQDAVVDSDGNITWVDTQDEPYPTHAFVVPQGAVGMPWVDSTYGVFPIDVSRYSMAGSVKQFTVEASLKDATVYGNTFIGFSEYNSYNNAYRGYEIYSTDSVGSPCDAYFTDNHNYRIKYDTSCMNGSPSNVVQVTFEPIKNNSVLAVFGTTRNEAVGGYNVTYYYCRIMKANDNTNYRLHRLFYDIRTSSSSVKCMAVPVSYNGGVYLLDPIRRILIKPVQNGRYNENEVNSWYISY